jgi:hypothetical protein
LIKPYRDWKKLLEEGLSNGYDLKLSNTGNWSKIAIFIVDSTRDPSAGINTSDAYYQAVDDFVKANIQED